MDFGAVGLEGFVGSDNPSSGFGSDRGNKYGSGILKQERSDAIDDDWRSSKVAKVTESMLLPQRNSFPKSNGQMLSFSCPKSEAPQSLAMPGFHLISYPYNRTAGYESLNSGNMHGVFTETRGPFTPSQWMELEHQALIYKYITANVPIPSNLLTPIRRALDSAISAYSGGILRPNTLSWGGWNLGFSGNSDPEPGRCRRTDGKKWRCSRDAVADQKYCERHMNRGRHRSRKHVEGQSGHSAAAASKPTLTASSASPAAVDLHGGGASSIAQNQQLKNPSNLSAAPSLNRMFLSKETLGERSKLDPKSKENPFWILKQQNPYPESSHLEFGRVNSDSLLNPSHNNSPIITSKNFDSSTDLTYGLSISIPVGPTDFMSSTSSPNHEKSTISSPRLPCDLDLNAFNQRQANWLPVSWETSMGGPLGEVLQNGNSNSGSECKSGSSVLTHLKDGWDSGSSPGFGFSPTGVLQKPTFGSLSNSSAGSSPRVEGHRANEGASLCCEFLAPV